MITIVSTIKTIRSAFLAIIFLFLSLQCPLVSSQAGILANTPVARDKRIRELIYSDSEVFEIKFRINYQSIIEFGMDESIDTIAVGDPYPWKITPTGRRLFIKASEPGVKTNMTVITDKKTYLFEISSDYSQDSIGDDVVYVVRFFYPEIPIDREKYSFEQAKRFFLDQSHEAEQRSDFIPEKPPVSSTGNFEYGKEVNPNYSLEGQQYDFTPLEVFDDKQNTYLRFADTSNLPSIFILRPDGHKERPMTNITDEFLVVRGVYKALTLEKGDKNNVVYNDNMK